MKIVLLLLMMCGLSLTACAQSPHPDVPDTVSGNPAAYDLGGYPAAGSKVTKPNSLWRSELSPTAYEILRQSGTEEPFTGPLLNEHRTGIFACAACGNPLFASQTKFESGTGWPSFWAPIERNRVEEKRDDTFGMSRTEILCARCGGHLGHVFDDGPAPTHLRYCMNSAALVFHEIR